MIYLFILVWSLLFVVLGYVVYSKRNSPKYVYILLFISFIYLSGIFIGYWFFVKGLWIKF
jgi:hypothetical protein